MKSIAPVLLLLVPQALAGAYSLADTYQGANFFDTFQFFTEADPTHGRVHVSFPLIRHTLPVDDDPSLLKVTMFRRPLLCPAAWPQYLGVILSSVWTTPHSWTRVGLDVIRSE